MNAPVPFKCFPSSGNHTESSLGYYYSKNDNIYSNNSQIPEEVNIINFPGEVDEGRTLYNQNQPVEVQKFYKNPVEGRNEYISEEGAKIIDSPEEVDEGGTLNHQNQPVEVQKLYKTPVEGVEGRNDYIPEEVFNETLKNPNYNSISEDASTANNFNFEFDNNCIEKNSGSRNGNGIQVLSAKETGIESCPFVVYDNTTFSMTISSEVRT